ncbi:Uncharacterised protein [Yersinia kristensenii]|nr:Uncharacterised protein [Yersinia kristensenii]
MTLSMMAFNSGNCGLIANAIINGSSPVTATVLMLGVKFCADR